MEQEEKELRMKFLSSYQASKASVEAIMAFGKKNGNETAKREISPELLKVMKEKREAALDKQREAFKKIAAFIAEFGDDEVKGLSKQYLTRMRTASSAPKMQDGPLSRFAELFGNADIVSEMDIFAKYKLGRGDVRFMIVNHMKKVKPENRIWVQLDPDAGEYNVIGRGPDAPSGYKGFIPKGTSL